MLLRNDRLRAEREDRGWTQRDLALRAGMHEGSIVRLESSDSQPRPNQLLAIAEALGVHPRWLVPLPSDPRLIDHRYLTGLTTKQVAEALGVATSSVTRVEHGTWMPADVETWAELYEIDVVDFQRAWERARQPPD